MSVKQGSETRGKEAEVLGRIWPVAMQKTKYYSFSSHGFTQPSMTSILVVGDTVSKSRDICKCSAPNILKTAPIHMQG